MKTIPLKHGGVALVDDDNFDELNKFLWSSHKDGNVLYAVARPKLDKGYGNIKMHHLILPCPRGMQTDHIDGDGLNNQKCNLRIVSHRQNQCNQHVNKTSKYPGVCFDKHAGKFVAGIKINGKRKSLGYFKEEFPAFQAYVVACAVLVGDSE